MDWSDFKKVAPINKFLFCAPNYPIHREFEVQPQTWQALYSSPGPGHSPYPSSLSLNIPIFIRMGIPCNKFNLINNRTQLQQQQQMDMQIKSGLRTHITITRESRKMIG